MTTILILLILIVIQKKLTLNGKVFYITLITALPLSYLINQIKLPISQWLFANHALDLSYGIIWVLIVGITEESIKFLLFLSLFAYLKHVNKNSFRNEVIITYCVGIGFGIGEIWYLLSLLIFSVSPIIQGNGWLVYLGGFGFERFFVTFGHAALFMIILFGWKKNKEQLLFYLIIAMLFHALYDFPIILNAVGLISSLELVLTIVLEIIFGFLVSFYLLDYFLRYKDTSERSIQKSELLKRAHE